MYTIDIRTPHDAFNVVSGLMMKSSDELYAGCYSQMNKTMISASIPDWQRERMHRWWDPSRQLLKSIRQYQRWRARGGLLGKLFSLYNVFRHRFWSVVTAADIPLNCGIGGGLLINHPTGIVIHPEAQIGPNCLIFQQVTIVQDVKIGGHVDIGAGAKIIRPVTIGDHALIGANAVVTHNVPAGATVVGIPARIRKV